jgi:hypothetical protein
MIGTDRGKLGNVNTKRYVNIKSVLIETESEIAMNSSIEAFWYLREYKEKIKFVHKYREPARNVSLKISNITPEGNFPSKRSKEASNIEQNQRIKSSKILKYFSRLMFIQPLSI